MKIQWIDKHLEIDPPKRTKKLTGTRFAAVFGKNVWKTPFQIWSEVTKCYEPPFEDTKYTLAGKTIEPKQAEFMKTVYAMTGLKTPEDVYGKDYFNRTHGDFFPDSKIFGGMWDYLVYDDDDVLDTVLEMKTTKRAEDWQDGKIPEYYALQAALYAYLLGIDNVVMVATVLEDSDYDHPENFHVSLTNTFVRPFTVSERYPNISDLIEKATIWWRDHVLTGISPDYDEQADADYLKYLRTNYVNPDTDIGKLLAEGEEIQAKLDEASKAVKPLETRLETIKKQVKELLTSQFRDGDKKVEAAGTSYVWSLARTEKMVLDEDKLKQDGIYDKYTKPSTTYRMTVSKKKEEKNNG